ncbi:MAG: ImmA/IrrE family metallo-endopeptidase [Acutalibacteraceae bacterium]|nr:ImmA/IrrE family metallo-endopeptidase [Acutalibacteraceae bacterium]
MIYAKYKNVRNASWQAFIDFYITELPVSVNAIAKQLDIKVIKNSDIHELETGERGVTMEVNGNWYIVFDDTEPVPVCRFTVAHELGHILLGHTMYQKKKYRTFAIRDGEEQEADMFAIRLLAPACVLHELQAFNADEIAKLCNISITAAGHRAERMALLEKRNKWYLHPLEREVYKIFEKYIKNYRKM